MTTGFGGDSGGVTPVPIPNTEVKPASADGTWAETPWESRTPPDFAYQKALRHLAQGLLTFFGAGRVWVMARRSDSRSRSTSAPKQTRPLKRKALPAAPHPARDPAVQLPKVLGAPRGKAAARNFETAARAFRAERFIEAQPVLARLAREAPDVADVRELNGLVLYRLGRYRAAMEELEAFRELSGSVEQHPVLADCHRALRRWADVEALWAELGAASPSAELVTEGRIVLAGSKADRGEIGAAITVLEKGWRMPSQPREHHLRRGYALADLYERAGRAPRARELFRWVHSKDPHFADVSQRVRSLS